MEFIMYIADIDYYRPTSLQELLDLLKKYGKKSKILAGGTDLILQMKLKSKQPACLIDVKGIDEFKKMYVEDDKLVVGCGVTLTELWRSQQVKNEFPALWGAVNMHADRQIRNRGTLVGNLCNASPAAETAPPLLTYGAQVQIQSSSGQRVVSLNKFFVGPGQTVLAEDELVTRVYIPKPPSNSYCSFKKLSRVYDDIAIINAAARLEFDQSGKCKSAQIFMGAVGPTVKRASQAEQLLVDKNLDDDLIIRAAQLARQDASPITDVRASAEYRRKTIGVLVERALRDIRDNQIHKQVGV